MIGIIGAMRVEVESLKQAITGAQTEKISGMEFTTGILEGKEVVVALCGVGKVFAALCAEVMILRFHPQYLINTGVAGTLTNTLHIGDIAVSTAAMQHDMDTSPVGDPEGLISGINVIEMYADADLCKCALTCIQEEGVHAQAGWIASADRFVADKDTKVRIVEHFPACIACEMEAGAIAQAAYINQVPYVVLRAISDNADEGVGMDYPAFVAMAAERSVKIVRRMLKKL